MTLPEWGYWWLNYNRGEAGGYACFYPDDIDKDHNLLKLVNGLKENHKHDFVFKDNKKIFVGCVNGKKPYLKFVSYEDNGKEFWELFLTEDETIPPVNMEKFY